MRKKTAVVLALGVILALIFTISSVGTFARENSLWTEIQKRNVLRIGVATCEPHCIKDPRTGEWSGVAIEIMQHLADVLGVELECVDTTWDYIIAGLQAEKWDIAVALNATPMRTLAVDFSIPFYFYEVSFVYKEGNKKIPPNPTSVEDFDQKGIVLAVMSGTAQDKSLTRVIKNATILRLPTVDETRMAVISGRADAVVDDDATNALFARTYDWARTVFPDPSLSKEGICFGFRKGYFADIQTLDILITYLKDTGQLRELELKYGTLLK